MSDLDFDEIDLELGSFAEDEPGFPEAFESGFAEGRESVINELHVWLRELSSAEHRSFAQLRRAGDYLAGNTHGGRYQAYENVIKRLEQMR